MTSAYRDALRLVLLTGQRPGEVVGGGLRRWISGESDYGAYRPRA